MGDRGPKAVQAPPQRLDGNRAKVSFAVPRDGHKADPAKANPTQIPVEPPQLTAQESPKDSRLAKNLLPALEKPKIHTEKRKVPPVEPETHQTMAEPPSKRAKRTDSPTIPDRNDAPKRPTDRDTRDSETRSSHRDRDRNPRGDHRQGPGRDERRYRSRSRERNDRRRDRSRSKERERLRDGLRERDGHGRRDRERSRSRSRDRYRSRRDPPTTRSEKQKDRSRSPPRNGTGSRLRSPPRGPRSDRSKELPRDDQVPNGSKEGDPRPEKKGKGAKGRQDPDKMQVDPQGLGVVDDEDQLMAKLMGFTTFKSTQNTKVPGNNVYGVRKEKKTEYRQYMNRVGGFNRPLSPSR